MSNITMVINGKEVEAEQGETVLEAATKAGIRIPTACHNDKLKPYGACRLCTVEIDKGGWKSMVASCCYPARDGLIIDTNNEKVRTLRKMIIEMAWPAEQHFAREYGVTSSRFNNPIPDCIECGLCVRYCNEIKKLDAVYFKGRGVERKVAFVDGVGAECVQCQECFSLCPSGWIVNEAGKIRQ